MNIWPVLTKIPWGKIYKESPNILWNIGVLIKILMGSPRKDIKCRSCGKPVSKSCLICPNCKNKLHTCSICKTKDADLYSGGKRSFICKECNEHPEKARSQEEKEKA